MINGPPPLGKTLVRICLSVSSSNCNLIIIDHHHNCRFQHQRHLCHDDHDENHQARRAVSLEASVEASHCIWRKPASVFFCFLVLGEAQMKQIMMTMRGRVKRRFVSPGLIANLLEVLWEIANCNLLLIVNGL